MRDHLKQQLQTDQQQKEQVWLMFFNLLGGVNVLRFVTHLLCISLLQLELWNERVRIEQYLDLPGCKSKDYLLKRIRGRV